MPSPSTPRRTANRRHDSTPPSKSKPVDVGVPLGIYDTNSVRDRVRQWQSQGGGVITASNIYIEEDGEEEPPGKDKPSKGNDITSSSKIDAEESVRVQKSHRRTGGRKLKADQEERDRSRSGSAPSKRVVSDAHWRTKRSPPKSTTPPRVTNTITAKYVQADDGIRVRPLPDPKPDRRPNKPDDEITPKKKTVGDDDGIRVFSTPPASRKESKNERTSLQQDNETQRETQREKHNNVDDASSGSSSFPAADSVHQRKHPTPEKSPRLGSSAAKEQVRRRKSGYNKSKAPSDEFLVASKGVSEGRGSTKSQRGNLLSQVFGDSRNLFSKVQPIPKAPPRVPSVEAWLEETSDPFLDDIEPSGDTVSTLERSNRLVSDTTEETRGEDPNNIWDSLDTKEGTRVALDGSRRRKRVRSSAIYEDNPFPADLNTGSPTSRSPNGTKSASKLVDLVQASPETPPPSLKRRGAKRNTSSPVRDRRKTLFRNERIAENDESSTVSSLFTTSSVEPPDPKFPLRPPGLNLRRPFPSTGQHRLSTIASVETFNTQVQNLPPPSLSEISEVTLQPSPADADAGEREARDHFDPNSLERTKSRLTKHADLISVLSLPRAGSKSIKSARSIRTNRSRLATATIGDLLKELATDESKYMRELRTLVDGVIPVLLTCVLSKSDSAVAAGLFRPSTTATNDPNFTKPIVDMGIALERLKTLHKRIPLQDTNALLTWAQGAQRVYAEYLKAWRMGFQDVVVNLAPAAEETSPKLRLQGSDLDEGLPRNKDGDVVDGDGERVDVAFLLKRPLIRLKYLSKTLKGINFISPSSEAETLANKYQNLIIDARNRSNEERARLEDEAAANIDPTRTRDPRTLAPLSGVTIDKTRHVRARDHFNLALPHSSGQCIDCRVELLLRDEANGGGAGGDLLICEVDGTGRWLLFPPVQLSRVSARNGDLKGEIIVMIRGFAGNGIVWQELFYLRTDDEQAGFEWVQMIGLTPVPPKIMRSQSFVTKHSKKKPIAETASSALVLPDTPSIPGKSRTPSPREVGIPIGEQANPASKTWIETPLENRPIASPVASLAQENGKLQRKPFDSLPSTPSKLLTNSVDEVSDLRSAPSQASSRQTESRDTIQTPRGLGEALGALANSLPSALRRSKAKRLSRQTDSSPQSPKSKLDSCIGDEALPPTPPPKDTSSPEPTASPEAIDHRPLSPEPILALNYSIQKSDVDQRKWINRPSHQRPRSSVPSLDLPTIPKVRKESPPATPAHEPEEEPDWGVPAEPVLPISPAKLSKRRPAPLQTTESCPSPPTPPHHSPSPIQLKGSKPAVIDAKTARNSNRRSSSPLKHEYEPSTASESSSDSETSTVEHNEVTSVSDSSEDEELEDGDTPTPLLSLGTLPSFPKASSQGPIYSLPNGTLSPSQSASQAPYKTVPSQPLKASKTIASIFSWSDKGLWESVHPDECSIVIIPGLIEAFKMSAAHSKVVPISSCTPVVDADAFSELASNVVTPEEAQTERPLVALELTPLVPLRRGTALDISIRSPPTANSLIASSNNIMFRSRNPEECEALYALINHSRINNPTYVALQNARGPYVSGSTFTPLDRRGSTRASGSRASSWFGGWGGSSGYRANSIPTPSIAPSESSIGSMASAFSALKRFGKGGSGFNIARSTISSRNGSRANSIYTSSDNSSGSGTSSPIPPGSEGANKVAPIGLSNAKIRLYIRESASRWRDMGSARLTIMKPSSPALAAGGGADNRSTATRANEKRIVINGKTKGEVLLDEQLGESCFERVARTGIALSVWEDMVGPNGELGVVGAVGGVGGGRARVYMIQVCALFSFLFSFSLTGGKSTIGAKSAITEGSR